MLLGCIAAPVEPIVMPFGGIDSVGPRSHVLDAGLVPTWRGDFHGKKGPAQDMPDMSSSRYAQSDSAGGRIGTVLMLIGVY